MIILVHTDSNSADLTSTGAATCARDGVREPGGRYVGAYALPSELGRTSRQQPAAQTPIDTQIVRAAMSGAQEPASPPSPLLS